MYRITLPWMLVFLLSHVPLGWATTVTVEWNQNTEPDLGGYKLYYGKTSRAQGPYAETVVINDKNTTDWSLTLTPDTYYFGLTAFDLNGNESGFSNEVSATIPSSEPPGKPGKPILILLQ